MSETIKCPNCRGEGIYHQDMDAGNDTTCMLCNGTGLIPVPTPDLLLTDVEKFKEGLADILLKPVRAYGAVTGSPEVTVYIHGASVSQILDRVDILIKELQQARPTEQAREKLLKDITLYLYRTYSHLFPHHAWNFDDEPDDVQVLWKQEASNAVGYMLRSDFLLPDEQAIRKEERKAIGEIINHFIYEREDGNHHLHVYDIQDFIASLQSGERPGGGG